MISVCVYACKVESVFRKLLGGFFEYYRIDLAFVFVFLFLLQLTLVVNSMAELLDRPSSAPASSSMMHMLQRHRDILYDYSKEFKKTKVCMIITE